MILSLAVDRFSHVGWNPWEGLEKAGIDVGWSDLPITGCYFPAAKVIALGAQLSDAEARLVLTHELAHHALGHLPHADPLEVDRMELRARRWAAVRLLSLEDLATAMRSAGNLFEVAEELGVDPELLEVRLRWLTDEERKELECGD